jgi:hypothetical protein
MATKQSIQKAYIDYVLTEGEQPKSVYVFAKKNKMTEAEFYTQFGSFDAIEQSVWTSLAETTLTEVRAQEVWPQYSSREKALSFFYSFFEHAKSQRSFVAYSAKKIHKGFATPKVWEGLKAEFETFAIVILQDGIDSGELTDRKFFADRYKDALWIQFVFALNFWINDSSSGFEKTDEAIEKGVNVTFDLFQRSPIDNLLDYGRFLAKHSGIKEKMGF